jgi:hypothetical protein
MARPRRPATHDQLIPRFCAHVGGNEELSTAGLAVLKSGQRAKYDSLGEWLTVLPRRI